MDHNNKKDESLPTLFKSSTQPQTTNDIVECIGFNSKRLTIYQPQQKHQFKQN